MRLVNKETLPTILEIVVSYQMTKISHLHPGSLNTPSKSNVFKLIPKKKDLRAPQTGPGTGLVYAWQAAKVPGEMPFQSSA